MPDTLDLRPDAHVVLANGLTVLARRDRTAPVVAIVTHVKAGYFDETDDVVGIAHVLEHMYFKGTARRSVGRIAQETKAHGGYLNAHTIYDHTCYYTVLPASAFAGGLDIQADAYAHSAIDAGELAKELEVIIQEAKRKADSPPAVAVESLYEMLYDRHRMRRWRIGRESGLRALTRADVLNFYHTYYRPSSTILVVVGDVDPDAAVREVERRYGGLPAGDVPHDRGPAEPPGAEFRCREIAGDIGQAQIAIGWRTPPSRSDQTPVLDLASMILGAGRASRLYRAVRERKLAASVSASNYTPTEVGAFSLHAEAPPDTALAAARAAWAQTARLAEEEPDAQEIARVQRIFEARWLRRLETMEGQAMHLAEWEALGGLGLARDYCERFLTADARAVRDAAAAHLRPEQASVLVYRPAAAPPVLGVGADMLEKLQTAPRERLRGVTSEAPRAEPATRAVPHREAERAGVAVYRLASGLPLLIRRRPGAAITYLGIYAPGGALEETPANAGITTLLTRTMLKGTTGRSADQLAMATELLGASLGASVGQESFGWSVSMPVTRVAEALPLLADVVRHPALEEGALETERAVALSSLALLRDDMYRYPMRLAAAAAFRGHAYGIPTLGTESSLAAASEPALRGWYEQHVLGAAPVMVAVGAVDPDAIANAAEAALCGLAPGARPVAAAAPWPARATLAVEERDKAQTALVMLFPAPARGDDDRFATLLLAVIASGLGGRFFEELRDRRSLAYTVHAFASEYRRAGVFGAYIATSPEQEDVAREGLLAEFQKLRESLVTAEELERAKRYAIGTHAIRQQNVADVAGEILDAWLFGRGLEELDEFVARVEAVTAEDIRSLAARYFDPERRVEGIVRGRGRTV